MKNHSIILEKGELEVRLHRRYVISGLKCWMDSKYIWGASITLNYMHFLGFSSYKGF